LKKNAIDEAVGCQISSRRLTLRWSVEQLAEKLLISTEDLAAYESGDKHVDAGLLMQFAKILDVAPAYFFEALKKTDRPC